MVGVPPERVLLVKADLPDGSRVSVGSATLIAARLVLTAAHVVFDESSGASLTRIVTGPPEAPRLFTAELRWPAEYHRSDSGTDLDVALLEITDPDWSPPAIGPVRWGRLTGRSPGVPCEATGFPRVLRQPDGVRESDQISATINPAAGTVTGRHDLNVSSAAPVPDDRFASPWSGSSGAGVFCDGLLTAVLVIDTGGYGHGRLTAVPAYRFVTDAAVRTLLAEHQVPIGLDSVELSPLLTTAGQQNQIRRRRPERISPAMLLRADYETVAFYGRVDLLTRLTEWCTDSNAEVDVRLITGPGGLGKTRLARQLVTTVNGRPSVNGQPSAHGQPSADQHPGRGWLAGFFSEPTAQHPLPVERLADTAAPVLLVIDYAETRAAEIAALLRCLWAGDGAPVRLLLLARAAGEWWDQLARDLDGPVGAAEELAPLDTTTTARTVAFQTAAAAFATRLPALPTVVPGVDWFAHARALTPPDDLDDPGYGSPLTLQLAALLRLLASADTGLPAGGLPAGGLPTASTAAEQELLSRHEQKYWGATVPARLGLHRDSLAEAVTVATLCGAASRDEALTVLTALPGLRQRTEDDRKAVADWLRDLYPAAAGQEWGGLQPDRVGEHLVAHTLTRRPSLLTELMAAASPAQRHQALVVLARALASPTIGESTQAQLTQQLTDLFSAGDVGLTLAGLALQVATETAQPQLLLDAVTAAAGAFGPRQLSTLVRQLPEQSLILAGAAAQLTAALVHAIRKLSGDTRLNLAASLSNLSLRHAALGRREDALAASTEAVGLYRDLAGSGTGDFNAHLAGVLSNHALSLAALGHREDALTASAEAVELYRTLAADQPDTITRGLAAALHNLFGRLAELGRREEALAAITEAVGLCRELAAARSEAFTADLAMSLTNLAVGLASLGRREDAFAASVEATDLYRGLAAARPDAFTADLAMSLTNLSSQFADLGRSEQAHAAAAEATDLFRELAAARPEAFTANLAMSLNYVAVGLAGLGSHQDALAASAEATDLNRDLAAAQPEAFAPNLAMSLTNLAHRLADLGRGEDALAVSAEATDLYRELAAARPDAFTPDLARSLNNLASDHAALDRHQDALDVSAEATDLYRELAAVRPDVFAPDLAKSLTNLAGRLADQGRFDEALTARTEAVRLHRGLAAARPDVHTPDLAGTLLDLGIHLTALSQHAAARDADEEATTLYVRLAAESADFHEAASEAANNLGIDLRDLGMSPEEITRYLQRVVRDAGGEFESG